MAKEKKLVISQEEDDRFALDAGGVAIYGECEQPPVKHDVAGKVVHATTPHEPLVHMICWDQEEVCRVEMDGALTVKGDEKAPLHVRMRHHFDNDHHQTHQVEPLDHALDVSSSLAEPIHHALQMRTPLQLRFCNPWHIASDYLMEVRLRKRRLMAIRLTGATVATPQPCEEEPCPAPIKTPQGHP